MEFTEVKIPGRLSLVPIYYNRDDCNLEVYTSELFPEVVFIRFGEGKTLRIWGFQCKDERQLEKKVEEIRQKVKDNLSVK